MVLLDAGLPRPRTQIRVTDGSDTAFLDLGWMSRPIHRPRVELGDRTSDPHAQLARPFRTRAAATDPGTSSTVRPTSR
jgi:hypothetical protein